MREYETIYLLKSDLPPEQLSEIKDKFNHNIVQSSGHMLATGDWGKRKLAYDIKKNRYAHYIYLRYLCGGEVVHNLERLLKIEDSVLKFLTVRLREVENAEELKSQTTAEQAAPEEVMSGRSDSGPSRRGDSGDGYRREGGRREYSSRDSDNSRSQSDDSDDDNND